MIMYCDTSDFPKYLFTVNDIEYRKAVKTLRKVNISKLYQDKVDARLLNMVYNPYTHEMNDDKLLLYYSDKFNYFRNESDCILWKLKYNL